VRWILLVGLGLDISGALLIVLGFLRRSPERLADESAPRWDFSTPLLRARATEQMYAESGVALIAAGFACQVAAYLTAFNSWAWIAGLAVAIGSACGGLLVGVVIARRRSKSFLEAAEVAARKLVETAEEPIAADP
jgi:hypothetical protein